MMTNPYWREKIDEMSDVLELTGMEIRDQYKVTKGEIRRLCCDGVLLVVGKTPRPSVVNIYSINPRFKRGFKTRQ